MMPLDPTRLKPHRGLVPVKWQTEEIGFGINSHRDHDLSLMEGCVIGEVEWVTVSAVHNGGGNWAVKSLWQLTHVEEICAP